jgi:hypothetical protein
MKCPTSVQCANNEVVFETEHTIGYAIWHPQMGGYHGKAIVEIDKDCHECDGGGRVGGCVLVHVWHDGEFTTDESEQPVTTHYCDIEQFIPFATKINELNNLHNSKRIPNEQR